MAATTRTSLSEQLKLADELLLGRESMFEPQDLPGRYGRSVQAVDHILAAMNCPAVVGGGWAVWRHGYIGRVTQDIDIVLPAERIDEFLQVASVSGFQVLSQTSERWPKLIHKETTVEIDILPEGQRPGVHPDLAPTTIPAPQKLGANEARLKYTELNGLIELKIAASRLKDKADVVELIRANEHLIEEIRMHLEGVHPLYVQQFDDLVTEAQKDTTR